MNYEATPLPSNGPVTQWDDLSLDLFEANQKNKFLQEEVASLKNELKELKNQMTANDIHNDMAQVMIKETKTHQNEDSKQLSDNVILFRSRVSDDVSAPVPCTLAGQKQIQLFRGPRDPLSAFYHHPLHWQNRTFISAEHAYQYTKLVHHKTPLHAQKEMLHCRSSYSCKQLAYKYVRTSSESWNLIKFDIMEEICIAKLQQCKNFKDALQKSGTAYLVHNTETESVWGCGSDLNGLNKMGHILMNVRHHDAEYMLHFPPLPKGPDVKPKTPSVPMTASAKSCPLKVVVIGNSNSRGLSKRLSENGLSGSGYVYPGQTVQQITSRVKNLGLRTQMPDAILVHVGDIEIRDSSCSVTTITKNIRTFVNAVRSESFHTPIIISGLPNVPGHSHLNHRIASVNSASSQLCHSLENVFFVSNKTATLANDQIHLTAQARDLLCRNISYLVKQCI
jgi:GTP cyclohydrolase II